MPTHDRPLIGSVVERTTTRTPSAPNPSRFDGGTPGTGFPIAQHRARSAFARVREGIVAHGHSSGRVGSATRADAPVVVPSVQPPPPAQAQARPSSVAPTSPIVDTQPIPTDADALRRKIHEANAHTIARMSEEDIERGKRAILEQLGEGTEELLRRVQEARRRKEEKGREADGQSRAAQVAQGGGADDAGRTAECDRDHDQIPIVASPTPRRASDGLATRPGVLRVKSLENIGQSVSAPLRMTSSTRPSSGAGRKLRFAEVTPDDVHVYESAPISPKRTVLALPPPPDTKDDSIVSLGTFQEDSVPFKRPRPANSPTETQSKRVPKDGDEPEEGTPEYIRRRYFPNVPANDPSVAWMEGPPREMTDPSAPRFDLQGVPIPTSLSTLLPSHLGLHHHAEGSHAGYTIDDIFLLARSTVPAQRASMLGVLARIAHRLGRQVRHTDSPENIAVFVGQERELRKRILAAGLSAIDQLGSLGARAVEVVWECLVEWDRTSSELEGVELVRAPDVVSSLQLDYFLSQITNVLLHAALPPESLAQLLAVVHWLAQQSNQLAELITATPRLVPTILNTFLLMPIPLGEGSVPPNPLALQLLITLASASRSNASALVDPADALLRFVTLLPPASPYSPALATTLLTYTLRFYTTLSSYGLYAHIATTASEIFTAIGSYVISIPPSARESANASDLALSRQLRTAWASLVETWTVCATDPHATSPPHEILWSQICAWGWATDARKLGEGLGREREDWRVYAAIWDVEAAWLEGARTNCIKGGNKEREEALQIFRRTFAPEDGIEFGIVRRALEAVQRDLEAQGPTTVQDGERVLKSLASAGGILASALRLWLACMPPLDDGLPLSAPPFALPLGDLSAISAALVKHPIWSLPVTLGVPHLQVHLRPLTRFIIQSHRVSRHIPGTTPQLWFAQALVFLSRLLPGDESHALVMLDAFLLVTPQFVGVDTAELSHPVHVDVLRPFLEYAVRPGLEVYVAPLRPSMESILRSSTLRLPSSSPFSSLRSSKDDGASDRPARTFAAGLPLTRDLLFTPLTHLLRSGSSPVLSALPPGDRGGDWPTSEADVVRATLLLAYAARRVLLAHGLEAFVHGAAEVAFACMRVCMLEHGVGVGVGGSGGAADVEVFRDASVERLMTWLLEPFTVRGGRCSTGSGCGGDGLLHARSASLEDASTLYLGATPFYQFYTDLVALYGAVSFGHRTFAALVVAPLAMHYAVDYRRALWCGGEGVSSSPNSGSGAEHAAGLGDVVRSVRLPIEGVICTTGGRESGDVREYLYPAERDVGVLGAYVAALVARDGPGGRGGVDGFLRLIAVHHVAHTVWGDDDANAGIDIGVGTRIGVGEEGVEAKHRERKRETEAVAVGTRREEIRVRLLRAVLMRGSADAVRDVVLYRQRARGAFVWPPACYRGGNDQDPDAGEGGDGCGNAGWREARVAFVRRAMGESAAARVGALLMPAT